MITIRGTYQWLGVVLEYQYTPSLYGNEPEEFYVLNIQGDIPQELDSKKFIENLEYQAHEHAKENY